MDGIETIVEKAREEEYYSLCREWEEVTGYGLEYDYYASLNMSTVNDYIAFTRDGKMKTKGDFISDFEIWKNPSMRVVPLAVQEFFKNGTLPQNFIPTHTNIYDFCIMTRATGDFYLEEEYPNGEIRRHHKLLRYFVSKNGSILFKRGYNSKGKEFNGYVLAPIADLANKQVRITYFNKWYEAEDYQIDHEFYVYKALKLISKVLNSGHLKAYTQSITMRDQLSLF